MNKNSLTEFTRGWFIGNFNPSLYKTDDCEVSVRAYKAGEVEKPHFHKIAREFTMILSGEFSVNDQVFIENDIITLEPNEVSSFSCISSGKTLVVKIPSVVNDKYLV